MIAARNPSGQAAATGVGCSRLFFASITGDDMSAGASTGRALILGDIEGITGVDDWRWIIGGFPGYDEACRAYEADVNAAVQGLFKGGAREVLVVDTHAGGTNVQGENLRDCRLIGGPSIMGR